VKTARQRNFEFDWVLDLDISKFFDSINHELLMKAVRKHAKEKWVEMYVERFLKAPIQLDDGTEEKSDTGTPQGGVISPLLANLYLHYAFDMWMKRLYPRVKFERYADDVVIHCSTEQECDAIRVSLTERLAECGLELHPQKTEKVYCKDYVRHNSYNRVSYTFLGYTFKPRDARSKRGRRFTAFSPAPGRVSQKELRRKLRERQTFKRTQLSVAQVAKEINPVVRGWMNYFKHFRKEELYSMVFYIEGLLIRWVQRKFRLGKKKAMRRISRLRRAEPKFFAHWAI
jgi:group II intron reverse transcriptase/maturase